MPKRQKSIPGTERETNREIADAAENYVEQRDKRIAMSETETGAKDALIAVMKAHGITVYRDDDADPPLTITLSSKDNVKVTEADSDDADDGDEPAPRRRGRPPKAARPNNGTTTPSDEQPSDAA